ncbi:hypothetical protein P4123_29340 [Pseudomonas aeruginosa]|nr:hypothetical protein [Pseudomonas aeruginosa]
MRWKPNPTLRASACCAPALAISTCSPPATCAWIRHSESTPPVPRARSIPATTWRVPGTAAAFCAIRRWAVTSNGWTAANRASTALGTSTLGGNLTLAVGGDLRGDVLGRLSGAVPNAGYDSAAVGNWLWRQGSGSTAGTADRTAWWINFGTYARQPGGDGAAAATQQVGFTGIGTLGGGDLSLKVAGDAGVIEARTSSVPQERRSAARGWC